MMKVTHRHPPRQPSRRVNLLQLGSFGRVLRLEVGQDVFLYELAEVKADFGRGFRLRQIGTRDEPYHVNVDSPGASTCECLGFLRHGMCKDGRGCKHVAGLKALIRAGRLPEGGAA